MDCESREVGKHYGILSLDIHEFMYQLSVDAEVAGTRPAFKIPTWMGGP